MTKIKTIPGQYRYTNAKGIPALDKMEIGEIKAEVPTYFHDTFTNEKYAGVKLPDGKTVFAKVMILAYCIPHFKQGLYVKSPIVKEKN